MDPLLSCPYSMSHQILKSRMQYHITKCSKNYPSNEIAVCPYDTTHRIPKPEYQFHISVCPNRNVFEKHPLLFDSKMDSSGRAPYYHPNLPTPEENWDNEPFVPAYEPNLKKNKPILRQLAGATKSERKKFRLQERKRVQNLFDIESAEEGACGYDTGDCSTQLPLPKHQSLALQGPNTQDMISSINLGLERVSIGTLSHTLSDNADTVSTVSNSSGSLGFDRSSLSVSSDGGSPKPWKGSLDTGLERGRVGVIPHTSSDVHNVSNDPCGNAAMAEATGDMSTTLFVFPRKNRRKSKKKLNKKKL